MIGESGCDRCHGEGFYIVGASPRIGQVARHARCDCVERRNQLRRLQAVNRDVPPKYQSLSFEHSLIFDLPGEVREQLRRYVADYERKHLPSGRGLWLSGPTGVGKTVAACAVLLAIAPRRRAGSCAYWAFRRLLGRIRDTYHADSSERASELLASFAGIELLVLDDIGAVRVTDWARDMLTDIVCERDELIRPTIFTTDLDDEQLARCFQSRVVRRMRENCVRIELPPRKQKRPLPTIDE